MHAEPDADACLGLLKDVTVSVGLLNFPLPHSYKLQ